jgi:5-bromo-4-chloroindolyl phosphate hydrolysis protein
VSIDDKDKLNKLIERKIEQERCLLAEVESSLSREYERILEVFVLE